MGAFFDFRGGERGRVGGKLGRYVVNVAPRSSQNWAADS